MIQSVQALLGMSLPVCKNKSKFDEPEIGQTKKFCVFPSMIVSPLISHVFVTALELKKTGLYDVVTVELMLKNNGEVELES